MSACVCACTRSHFALSSVPAESGDRRFRREERCAAAVLASELERISEASAQNDLAHTNSPGGASILQVTEHWTRTPCVCARPEDSGTIRYYACEWNGPHGSMTS
eukprot:6184896-Pleurochrysis_carterae.AAC.1